MNPFKSESALQDYLAKARTFRRYPGALKDSPSGTESGPPPDEGPESALQTKIEAWCKEWGRPFLSLRSSKRARGFIRQTWVDVTIAMPNKRTIYLELKAKDGRMSEEQKMLRLQLLQLGHEVYEVRSYKRFLEIVR
jgi:hypothetical protein